MTNISNVFIVDDDSAVRNSLRMLLIASGFSVATFQNAEEFLAICNPQTKGCIILDVNMPGMNGSQMQEELNRRGWHLPIIFLTGQGSIPLSVRAMKSGAMDFLVKPVDSDELISCVKQALDKCSALQNENPDEKSNAELLASLTSRELEVAKLIIEGMTSKEIAKELSLSHRTVDNYRANIMHKTGSTNIIEFVRVASVLMPN